MPKNTTERIIDRPLSGRQTARVWSGSSGSASTGTGGNATTDALLAVPFLTLTADTTLTNERYLDVTNGLTKFDEGAGARLLLALEVPGTLTVSSTNTSTGNHTHAITSSSNPGAAASILASSAAGDLTLPTLTATTHVRTPLINTASGNLQLSPFADVYVSKQLGIGVSTVEALLHIETTDTATTNFLQIEGNRNAADTEIGILFKDRTAVSGGQQVARIYVDRQGSTGNFDLVFHGGNQTNAGLSSEIMRMKGVDGKVGILQDAPAYTLDVTGNGRFTTSLTTPLLTTETNVDMVINPAGTGAVQFPNDQTLRTTTFDSSFPITGWQINEVAGVSGYSALTIGKIQADELAVRVFVADEVRVDRGDEYWTKSYGIVATTFTTPGSIGGTVSVKFEDSPALVGAIFTNNDWVLIRKLDIDTGITLSNIWGQVATYVNNSDGTQNWTFTLRSGPTAESVTKGSLAIDFGASGAALIHLSVIDAAGAPYIKMRKWSGANPYTPANFTTYVQLGHLGSTGNTFVTPTGFGLYARATSDASRFILSDDNGLQIRGASFRMYNSELQTVDIGATNGSMKLGTNIASAATTSFDFNGATGDLSITGDLYTSKVYLLRSSGLNTEEDTWGSWENRRALQWWPDITNMTGNPSLSMYTGKHSGGSFPNQNWAYIDSNPTGGVLASLSLTANGQGTGADAIVYLEGGSQSLATNPSVTITAGVIDLVGTPTLSGTASAQHFNPKVDVTYSLGTALLRWDTLYVNQIIAGSVSGTTMNGAEWEYSGSMVIDANSASNTTVSVVNQGSGQASLDVEKDIVVGGLVDGVDIALFKTGYDSHTGNANAHHSQSHILATTSALGSDHTVSGLSTGLVLRATGSNTAAFTQLQHSELGALTTGDPHTQYLLKAGGTLTGNVAANVGVTIDGVDLSVHVADIDAHHAMQHDIAAATQHTITSAALGLVGATATNTLGIVAPSANPGAASAVLRSDNAGALTLVQLSATTKVQTPLIDTISGNLELAPVGSVHISRPLGVGVASPIYPLQVAGSGFFSGQLYLSDGTVSAPGLSFPGDPNSGIHHAGEDAYALVAGGAKIANVGAAGVAINTPYDASAALMVQSAVGSDITALFKRIAGQTARIWRITDENDHDLIILDDEGNLESGTPGFLSGLTGWQLTATGNAEFNNARIRGELHASIFVADEFHASSGTTIFATAGKLLNDAIILGGNSVLIDIKDPAVGHARIFSVGDRLRAKAIGALNIPNSGTIYPSFPGVISHAMNSNAGITTLDIWLQVAAISDMLTHWRYTCTRLSGSDGTLTAGTAIIRWGGIGDGLILATSDLNHAPYLDVFTSGAQPWAGDILPHARFGRLTGVGVLSQNHEWGMVAGTNLADNTQPYVVASNGGVDLYKVRLTLSDNSNPTVQMLPSGDVRFGRDVATSGGTGFHFDPATGNVTIGHYPDGQYLLWDQNTGSVTLNGNLIVDAPATAHWNNIVGRPADESILNQYTTISDIAGLDAISGDYRDVVSAEILTSITGALTVSVTAGSSIKFRGGAYATKNLNTASIATLFTGYRTYVYVKAGNTNDNNIYSTNVLSTLSVNDVLIGLIIGGAEKASWQALWGKTFIGDNSIVTGAILATHIKAGAVTADAIAAGSITASRLSITTLEAITAMTGALSVTGAMTIGTNGGIYQGTGTFASPTTGLKIWNDSGIGRIGGYNTGTLQWYANTDGKLSAGGGNALLDSNGISVIGSGVFRIMENVSTLKGYLYSSNPLDSLLINTTGVGVKTNGSATSEGISLRANASGGRSSEVAIEAAVGGGGNRVRMITYSGSTATSGQLTLGESSFTLALNGTGTTDFSVDGSGNVVVGGDLTTYSLDAGNRSRMRTGASGTAGIWYADSGGTDRVFSGLHTDNSTPLWGTWISGAWRLLIDYNGNVSVGDGASFGGGAGVVYIKNATTVPTSNPSGGGIIYVQGGALKYRGSSGTVTTIANA